jgi:hypothetical protein
MKLGKEGRAYISGKVKSLLTGKDIELTFLIDPGSTSGQLPSVFIKALGSYHHTEAVGGSLGEELDRDFYENIRVELPGVDLQGNSIALIADSFIGEAVPGRGPVIGTNQLLAMKASLLLNYSSREFSLLRNF